MEGHERCYANAPHPTLAGHQVRCDKEHREGDIFCFEHQRPWCWLPNCDGRCFPHIHDPSRIGGDGYVRLGDYSAASIRKMAKEFSHGWNGDSHLTDDERLLLEDETRWLIGRAFAQAQVHLLQSVRFA